MIVKGWRWLRRRWVPIADDADAELFARAERLNASRAIADDDPQVVSDLMRRIEQLKASAAEPL